jgi:hypothetical protein
MSLRVYFRDGEHCCEIHGDIKPVRIEGRGSQGGLHWTVYLTPEEAVEFTTAIHEVLDEANVRISEKQEAAAA